MLNLILTKYMDAVLIIFSPDQLIIYQLDASLLLF